LFVGDVIGLDYSQVIDVGEKQGLVLATWLYRLTTWYSKFDFTIQNEVKARMIGRIRVNLLAWVNPFFSVSLCFLVNLGDRRLAHSSCT